MAAHRKHRRKDLRGDQRGFAMLLVFLMASVVAITLYLELPRVAMQKERDKEQLLIDRGEQYKRAIQLFFNKAKRYPGDIKELESFQNQRFLRQRYTDPMTGKDEWRLIHIQNGVLTDSKLNKPQGPGQQKDGGSTAGQFVGEQVAMGSTGNQQGGAGANARDRRRASEGGAATMPGGNLPGGNLPSGDVGGVQTPGTTPIPGQAQQPGTLAGSGNPNYPVGQQFPGMNGQPGQQYPGVNGQPMTGLNGQPGQQYPGMNGQPGQQFPGMNGQPGQQYPGVNGQPMTGMNGQPAQPLPGMYAQPGQPYPGMNGQPGQRYPGMNGQPVTGTNGQPLYPPGMPAGIPIEGQPGMPGGFGNRPAMGTPASAGGSFVGGGGAYVGGGGSYVGGAVAGAQPGNPGQPGFPSQTQYPGQNLPPQPGPPVNSQNPGSPYPIAPGSQGSSPGFPQPGAATGQSNAAADMIRNMLTTPRPGGMPTLNPGAQTIGGGIAGVASKAEGEGVKLYNDRSLYSEWEFIYDPQKQKQIPNPNVQATGGTPVNQMGAPPGPQQPGQNNGLGMGPGNGPGMGPGNGPGFGQGTGPRPGR